MKSNNPKGYKGIVIFDLDGCVMDDAWRRGRIDMTLSGHDQFRHYHDGIIDDQALQIGYERLKDAVDNRLFVAFITARPLYTMDATVKSIYSNFELAEADDYILWMRPNESDQSSPDLKTELAHHVMAHARHMGIQVVAAFDDRSDVCDAYRKLGIPTFQLDHAHCELKSSFRNCVLSPTADGPVQKQPGPPSRQRDAGDVLREGLATFDSRRAQYGQTHVKNGDIMAILFPGGITLNTSEDHQMFHAVGHMVGKLVRFASTGLKHEDSAHDLAVYSAQAVSLVDGHDIKIP